MGERRIIRNAIRCNLCGGEAESRGRWHMVYCPCGKCAADGGRNYLRRLAPSADAYTDISEFAEAA